MPPRKSKKNSRRGSPAPRPAQPRTPRESPPPPSAGSPPAGASPRSAPATASPGPEPAQRIPPGLTSAKKTPTRSGPATTKTTPPGPASPQPVPAGLIPAKAPSPNLPAGPPRNGRAAATAVRSGGPPATKAPAGAEPQTAPASTDDDLPSWAAKAVEELLTPTYWLDPGEDGEPFSATIRFSGQRTDVTGKPQPRDSFWQEETVDGIIPGSGPVAVTAEVRGINPGQWTVTARSVARVGGRPYRAYPSPGHDPDGTYRVPAPRRVAIPAESTASVHTSSLLRSKVPGVIRFAYATLVGLGVLTGLALEALLLSHGHYALFRPMLFSVIAIVAGVIGGKTWYIAVHRGKKFDGWCIQGFVAGAAVVVAAAALAGPGIPAGAYLAAAAPALLIGMSIGRPGCFWAGCCTGRPVAARWGIWSSDRRLGCRRAPVQLLEAASALVSGGAVLAVVLADGLARSGPVAVVGLAFYTVCRQFILGLRAEPRVWQYGRRVTGTIALLALIAGIILLVRS